MKNYDTAFTSERYGDIHRILINIVKETKNPTAKRKICRFLQGFHQDIKSIEELTINQGSREFEFLMCGLIMTYQHRMIVGVHTKNISTFLDNYLHAEIEMKFGNVISYKHLKNNNL